MLFELEKVTGLKFEIDARENYSTEQYADWKDKTLAYYSRLTVAERADEAEDNAIKVKIVSAWDI